MTTPNNSEKALRDCVEYCRQQNGMDECKNCGLDDAMITEALSQAYKQGKIEATVEETAQYKEDMKKAKEEARREELKNIILAYQSNELEGKGFDFYFAIRTRLDELTS